MTRAAWIGVALAACLATAGGCPKPPLPPDTPDTPGTSSQRAATQRALAAWFECEECVDGELQGVLTLGPAALPSLSKALSDAPSSADLTRLERELRARHRELAAFASRTPAARFELGPDAFVERYRANYVARIQGRAAWALGEIGGPDAERALRSALALGLRADVESGVRAALARAAGPP